MEHESNKKGFWNAEEDTVLADYIKKHGTGKWNRIPKVTGLKRSGKSCRLRWMNYLSPKVKRGDFSEEEEDLVIRLHNLLGNRWSLIAGRIPGRTDNQVKNFWNTHLSKKLAVNNKNKKRKICAPLNSISTVKSRDNCNSPLKSAELSLKYINEGEKLVHESLSGDLIDFANIHEEIMADDFGCTFADMFDLCTPYLTDPFQEWFFGL